MAEEAESRCLPEAQTHTYTQGQDEAQLQNQREVWVQADRASPTAAAATRLVTGSGSDSASYLTQWPSAQPGTPTGGLSQLPCLFLLPLPLQAPGCAV